MPAETIPPRLNLARYCLGRAAAATADKLALMVMGDAGGPEAAERLSFGALERMVLATAAGLIAMGLAPGDRLLLKLPNDSDYAVLFFGAIAAGLVPVPVSAQLTDAELALLIADSGAAAIAADGRPEDLPSALRHIDKAAMAELKRHAPAADYADTAAEDPAYMIYTSGTSGRPKGVLHAHRVGPGREPMRRDWQAIGPDDVMLHAGAFNWSFTLGVGLIDPWSVGATAVLYTGPKDPAIWPGLIEASGATLFAAVPSLYRQMLKYGAPEPTRFARLRHGLAAGEALPEPVRQRWLAATGRPLYEAFGMSECSTFISAGPDVIVRPGSAGRPQRGRPIAVLPLEGSTRPLPPGEVGLLAIHRADPGLMLGYWRRPDEDAACWRGDWFVGGDLAAGDADGYIWHHGRAHDIMNAGGFRVAPAEVEAALADCPGVAEVAVGEFRVRPDVSIIAAWVVRAPGSGLDEAAILAHASSRLAAYKRPRQVFFREVLPRSPNGKLLRRELR